MKQTLTILSLAASSIFASCATDKKLARDIAQERNALEEKLTREGEKTQEEMRAENERLNNRSKPEEALALAQYKVVKELIQPNTETCEVLYSFRYQLANADSLIAAGYPVRAVPIGDPDLEDNCYRYVAYQHLGTRDTTFDFNDNQNNLLYMRLRDSVLIDGHGTVTDMRQESGEMLKVWNKLEHVLVVEAPPMPGQ